MQLSVDFVRNEVSVFIDRAKCKGETCEGELVFSGLARLSYPPQYEHSCTKCETKAYLSNRYPQLAYSPN